MKTVEYYLAMPYGTRVVPEECTDGTQCYVARIDELPGCESHGDTPEEALVHLQEAQRLYLETMIEDGVDPPEPVAVTEGTYSGLKSIWRIEDAGSVDSSVIMGPTKVTLPV